MDHLHSWAQQQREDELSNKQLYGIRATNGVFVKEEMVKREPNRSKVRQRSQTPWWTKLDTVETRWGQKANDYLNATVFLVFILGETLH